MKKFKGVTGLLASRSQTKRLFLYLVAFGVIGGLIIIFSHAAVINNVLEPESGSISGNATTGTDGNSSNGFVTFRAAGAQCPSGQVGTPPNCVAASSALGVNTKTIVSNFDAKIKGIALGAWNFSYNRPYIGEIPTLTQGMIAIKPGIVRYAGGLQANHMGFSRNMQQFTPHSSVNINGQNYEYNYGTDELASVDKFAKNIGADVMIQVNLSNNDPNMWADLVRYAQEKGFTSFKYYEYSNELDLEVRGGASGGISPTDYANRVATYQRAMLAVNPNIRIVGGGVANATDLLPTNYNSCCKSNVNSYIMQGLTAAHNAGHDFNDVSFHWYPTWQGITPNDLFKWTSGFSPNNNYADEGNSRNFGTEVGGWMRSRALGSYPNTKIGISELGTNADGSVPVVGNHVGALWFSDELGRLAYSGVDWITQWDSYTTDANEFFSLIYGNEGNMNVRPTYYPYIMYSKWFGNQMVQSSSYDNSKITIWASKDTTDPNKLKLRITNFTGGAINAPVALSGFSATGGQGYTMSSSNPLDMSAGSAYSSAPTTINGVKINGNNVAGSIASIQPNNVPASGTSFSYNIPAYSSVAIVLNGNFL